MRINRLCSIFGNEKSIYILVILFSVKRNTIAWIIWALDNKILRCRFRFICTLIAFTSNKHPWYKDTTVIISMGSSYLFWVIWIPTKCNGFAIQTDNISYVIVFVTPGWEIVKKRVLEMLRKWVLFSELSLMLDRHWIASWNPVQELIFNSLTKTIYGNNNYVYE